MKKKMSYKKCKETNKQKHSGNQSSARSVGAARARPLSPPQAPPSRAAEETAGGRMSLLCWKDTSALLLTLGGEGWGGWVTTASAYLGLVSFACLTTFFFFFFNLVVLLTSDWVLMPACLLSFFEVYCLCLFPLLVRDLFLSLARLFIYLFKSKFIVSACSSYACLGSVAFTCLNFFD